MYSISEAAKILGVSIPTLRRWDKSGKFPSLRTLGGHRRYPQIYIDMYLRGEAPKKENVDEEKSEPHCEKSMNTAISVQSEISREPVVYARVSSFKQKKEGNLQRQIDRIIENAKLDKNIKVISEYGSGLNTDRRGLNRLLREVEQSKISEIYIEYKDRLTRFGFAFLERYCKYFGPKIIPISNNEIKSPAEELSEDIMALLVCFSGKLYSKRKNGKNYSEPMMNEKELEKLTEKKIIEEQIKRCNDIAWQFAVKVAIT